MEPTTDSTVTEYTVGGGWIQTDDTTRKLIRVREVLTVETVEDAPCT